MLCVVCVCGLFCVEWWLSVVVYCVWFVVLFMCWRVLVVVVFFCMLCCVCFVLCLLCFVCVCFVCVVSLSFVVSCRMLCDVCCL